ncbi:MAG: glutamine--fructose-6-phosphate transaminase (isomerizing) [Armatimonadetes bacterium]|nr:glutamine--fructose-6-phosphate transaminase (isomerizing) [Armatimonadota bacterium]MDE2207511.1 glutamine--fructose-6-phosphate transaminase (isomerizing) [Armatimonadota bacterium]
MCGITAYSGPRSAVETALVNLKRLEYRGYDSAGVAYVTAGDLNLVRAAGKIQNLSAALVDKDIHASVAIAHTRWATHGAPTELNAHPHRDCTGRIAVVHNGIIENYREVRERLSNEGHCFASETDTETIAHLIEHETLHHETVRDAIAAAVRQLKGSFALAIIHLGAPETVFAVRNESPLVIGLGDGENFLASDIPAVMNYTRRVILLENRDVAVISRDQVTITDWYGEPVERAVTEITWDDAAAEKGGCAHFMLKEIYEEPRTVANALRGRVMGSSISLDELPFTDRDWRRFKRLAIVGCGTAYHAGVVGKRLFEELLRVPVETTIASEFRYSEPIVDDETLLIVISQSGETADTLAAMREGQRRGATALAIVNVVGSTLARDANASLLTYAGPEIGVCSTKAYLAQVVVLAELAAFLAERQHEGRATNLIDALARLPEQVAACLKLECELQDLARSLTSCSTYFFLGRGYDYAAALEAALKLKEISYLHAEAYPAGEMKHGPLALVESGVTVVGLCTQERTLEKMHSNLKEVKARNGRVIAVIREADVAPDSADDVIRIPGSHDALMPALALTPLQLFAYHIALQAGCEIDQPRNLAKSVTVE